MADGSGRLWATSTDTDVLEAAITTEMVGAAVQVTAGEFSC